MQCAVYLTLIISTNGVNPYTCVCYVLSGTMFRKYDAHVHLFVISSS